MIARSLLDTLEGRRDEAVEQLRSLRSFLDPEGRYYVARGLAKLGDTAEALAILEGAVAGGFFCLPALTRDSWLDPLRSTSGFVAITRAAEQHHRRAMISFLDAEGERPRHHSSRLTARERIS